MYVLLYDGSINVGSRLSPQIRTDFYTHSRVSLRADSQTSFHHQSLKLFLPFCFTFTEELSCPCAAANIWDEPPRCWVHNTDSHWTFSFMLFQRSLNHWQLSHPQCSVHPAAQSRPGRSPSLAGSLSWLPLRWRQITRLLTYEVTGSPVPSALCVLHTTWAIARSHNSRKAQIIDSACVATDKEAAL